MASIQFDLIFTPNITFNEDTTSNEMLHYFGNYTDAFEYESIELNYSGIDNVMHFELDILTDSYNQAANILEFYKENENCM